jgi:hypothetical protein
MLMFPQETFSGYGLMDAIASHVNSFRFIDGGIDPAYS